MYKEKRKIAVLYIGLGEYSVLWEEFYKSAQKYLFTEDIKHFFLFTDSEEILNKNLSDVTVVKWKNLGGYGNTQYRYAMFASIEGYIKNFDYTFFFNGNTKFVKNLSQELLPDPYNLVFAEHFKFKGKNNLWLPYIRNPKSTAYVKWGEGQNWIQACFLGGTTDEFIKMSIELARNTDIDVRNGEDAYPYDEAQVNCYITDKKYKLLPVSYVYPEILKLPCDVNILMRDKEKYFNTSVARLGKSRSALEWICWKIHNQIVKIKNLLHIFYYETKHLLLGHY